MDVYLDAVFHPNCVRDPKTFAQEGWHYELETPEACIHLCPIWHTLVLMHNCMATEYPLR